MFNGGKRERGVVTVLVSLMLAGILSLGTLVLEAGRFQAAKTQLAEANISAGTSMIASYNAELYSRYGLLAIDNEAVNIGRYRNYLEFNSDLAAGYKGNNLATLYAIDSVEMEGLYNLTYPAVLKRQILARAKYHIIPQDYSLNYYNMDYFLSDLQTKAEYISTTLSLVANGGAAQGTMNDVPNEMQAALNALQNVFKDTNKYDLGYDVTLSSSTIELLPSTTGTVENQVPTEDIAQINNAVNDAKTILGSNGAVLESNGNSTYNETDVSVNMDFISNAYSEFANVTNMYANAKQITEDCRTMVQGINAAMNMLNADKEGNLLLNSYISGYFPCRNYTVEGYVGPVKGTTVNASMENATFSGACVEYVLGGEPSEKNNQQVAYDYVMAVRFVNNLYATIVNSSSFNSNNECSVASHIAWAYYETCADAELLAKYNAIVPFGKYNMILPINEPMRVKSAFSSGDFLNGMKALGILNGQTFTIAGTDKSNYRDVLALALWFVPNSEKLIRTADLIQLDMRYFEQHVKNATATFLMSEQNTFCRVKCNAKLNSILPIISLGTNSGVNGISFQSVKYVGY